MRGTPGSSREAGTVKWFSNEKGYGFIERDGGEDVFVHHSQISMDGFRTLDAGDAVEFEIVSGERGPKAQDVRREGESGGSAGRGSPDRAGASSTGAPARDEARGEGSMTLVQQIRHKLGGRFFS